MGIFLENCQGGRPEVSTVFKNSDIYLLGKNKFIFTPGNYLLIGIVRISCPSDDKLPSCESNQSLIAHADKTI